jgi:hypothetical protein
VIDIFYWLFRLETTKVKFLTLHVGIHILIFFLAHLAKGTFGITWHLSFVVCHLLTFHILIFSETHQPNELKLNRSIYGRSSLKSAHFVMIHCQTWPPQAILVSDWPIFKNLLRFAKLTETW